MNFVALKKYVHSFYLSIRSETVTTVENGLGGPSSNLRYGCLHLWEVWIIDK